MFARLINLWTIFQTFSIQIPENIFNKMLKAWIVDDCIHKGDNIVYLVYYDLYYTMWSLPYVKWAIERRWFCYTISTLVWKVKKSCNSELQEGKFYCCKSNHPAIVILVYFGKKFVFPKMYHFSPMCSVDFGVLSSSKQERKEWKDTEVYSTLRLTSSATSIIVRYYDLLIFFEPFSILFVRITQYQCFMGKLNESFRPFFWDIFEKSWTNGKDLGKIHIYLP